MEEIAAPGKIGPYILAETIGRGCFSIVKKAIDIETRKVYACKIISRRRLVFDNAFRFELEAAKRLCHPNIVTFYDFLTDTLNCYLIMELCSGVTLQEKLLQDRKLSESVAGCIFWQLMDVVNYLSRLSIAHRDIKSENIMIDANLQIKVIDFGFASIEVEGLGRNELRCGTYYFCAPEILSDGNVDPRISDVWSCGVVLYQMLTGDIPWNVRSDKPVETQIKSGDYFMPPRFSPSLKELLGGLLCVDPETRWTPRDALQCQWLRGMEVSWPQSLPPRVFSQSEFVKPSMSQQPTRIRLWRNQTDRPIAKDTGRMLLRVAGRRVSPHRVSCPPDLA